MKKFGPIFLIWCVVILAIVDVMTRLMIISWMSLSSINILLVGIWVVTTCVVGISFVTQKRMILSDIKNWDVDSSHDIKNFIKSRQARLISSSLFLFVLVIVKMALNRLQSGQKFSEMLSYVFVVVSFHIALVSTLIFSKLYRASSWVRYENHLEKSEKI